MTKRWAMYLMSGEYFRMSSSGFRRYRRWPAVGSYDSLFCISLFWLPRNPSIPLIHGIAKAVSRRIGHCAPGLDHGPLGDRLGQFGNALTESSAGKASKTALCNFTALGMFSSRGMKPK